MTLSKERLLRISIATKNLVETWCEGVDLNAKSGVDIAVLCNNVAVDRFKLGNKFRRDGLALYGLGPKYYRSSISRFYYAMYHYFRSIAFISNGGDDFEKHNVLPKNLPSDFPSVAHWANELKNAREFRNEADYDPYPKSDGHWSSIATNLNAQSKILMPLIKNYLKSKGCSI